MAHHDLPHPCLLGQMKIMAHHSLHPILSHWRKVMAHHDLPHPCLLGEMKIMAHHHFHPILSHKRKVMANHDLPQIRAYLNLGAGCSARKIR